jgi:hypothetical protein
MTRGVPAFLVVLAGLAAAAAVAVAGSQERGSSASGTGFRDSFPLRFDSESVRLFVEEDTLRVEGTYRFLCRESESPIAALLYPYPADSSLGAARTLSLEGRAPGLPWRPLDFVELPGSAGVRWRVPLDLGDTLEVRTVYLQRTYGRTARYIVMTTHAWQRPLREARFEIHLPAGATPTNFSYPFTRRESAAGVFYSFEAKDFIPDGDIIVEYQP